MSKYNTRMLDLKLKLKEANNLRICSFKSSTSVWNSIKIGKVVKKNYSSKTIFICNFGSPLSLNDAAWDIDKLH